MFERLVEIEEARRQRFRHDVGRVFSPPDTFISTLLTYFILAGEAVASMREQKAQSAFLGSEQRGLNNKLERNRKRNKREKIMKANRECSDEHASKTLTDRDCPKKFA